MTGYWLIGVAVNLVRASLERRRVDPTVLCYLGSVITVTLNVLLVIGIRGYFGIQATIFAALIAAAGIAWRRGGDSRFQPGRPSAGGAPVLPQRPLLAGLFREQQGDSRGPGRGGIPGADADAERDRHPGHLILAGKIEEPAKAGSSISNLLLPTAPRRNPQRRASFAGRLAVQGLYQSPWGIAFQSSRRRWQEEGPQGYTPYRGPCQRLIKTAIHAPTSQSVSAKCMD